MGRRIKLGKLPSVIADNDFDERGLVRTDSGLLVPAYVGSGWGFCVPGREKLEGVRGIYERFRTEAGVLALCPFAACSEYLNLSRLSDDMTVKEHIEFWDSFNNLVGIVNYETLMPRAKFMIALFDFSHSVDEGLASEVAYFAVKHGKVIGIRSDFRLAENAAAPINPAVRYFLDQGPFEGELYTGPKAYDNAYARIKILAQDIREAA